MSTLTTRLRGSGRDGSPSSAFVVGVPAVLLAIDAVPDPGAFAWSRLTAPDDGSLAMEVIAAVCWIAWAVFTCQLIASIVSQIRGIRAPRLAGTRRASDRGRPPRRRRRAALRRGPVRDRVPPPTEGRGSRDRDSPTRRCTSRR